MAIQYRVYVNDGAGGLVDYGSPLTTTSSLTYTPSALGLNTDTTFAVRAYDTVSGLDDLNTDARVRIVVDGSGNNITDVPVAPATVGARAVADGDILVEWTYPWRGPDRVPTGFRVYQGTSSVSYASPVATVDHDGAEAYSATITGLADGTTYRFAVRAYNAIGTETNTVVVSAVADATPPDDVIDLAGYAI